MYVLPAEFFDLDVSDSKVSALYNDDAWNEYYD